MSIKKYTLEHALNIKKTPLHLKVLLRDYPDTENTEIIEYLKRRKSITPSTQYNWGDALQNWKNLNVKDILQFQTKYPFMVMKAIQEQAPSKAIKLVLETLDKKAQLLTNLGYPNRNDGTQAIFDVVTQTKLTKTNSQKLRLALKHRNHLLLANHTTQPNDIKQIAHTFRPRDVHYTLINQIVTNPNIEKTVRTRLFAQLGHIGQDILNTPQLKTEIITAFIGTRPKHTKIDLAEILKHTNTYTKKNYQDIHKALLEIDANCSVKQFHKLTKLTQ